MNRIVTDYLDRAASNFPNKFAFVDDSRKITFQELQSEAQQIGMKLIEKNIFKQPIVIFLDKSVECIAAFMGIAYSGNFYTVLDTKMPLARIEKILSTLQAEFIITDENHKEYVDSFANGATVFNYENFVNERNIVDPKLITSIVNKIIDTDVLYILFTSGSTGNPKGVIISHKAVISYTEWGSEAFGINETTTFGNQTPFYFSMSVFDIYQTLCNACTMYIIPISLFSFPVKLLTYLAEKHINMIYWVPSALCLVANLRALGKKDISCVQQVLFAGEVMPAKQLNMWRKNLPNALFANLFGPTEVTDICNYYIIKRTLLDNEPVPIGEACKNMGILILNKKNQPVIGSEKGELCVRGSSLAYGYYNDAEKTKAVFVQNPVNPYYEEKIYRTGDLVHYNDLGELIYDCRKDFQIKHMGHRIELGEIETVVSSVDGVMQNCCLYNTMELKIVLFFTGDILESQLLDAIENLVPIYMVPKRIIKLDQMPLNLNGKIDRVKLKEQL